MATFFTSDHHLGHTNFIRYCGRSYASVVEMNVDTTRRWNEVLAPDDQVCGNIHEKWTIRDGVVNVGVDHWGYRPITLARIVAAFCSAPDVVATPLMS